MTKHKAYRTKEYDIWMRMKKSCYTPTYPQYKNYGAKGVTICQLWRTDFCTFIKDMGAFPKWGKGIAMKRPDLKFFAPGNAKWTKGRRGRPKRPPGIPATKKKFSQPAKVFLTMEHDFLEAIKRSAEIRTQEIGHLVEPQDVLRDLIKKAFPKQKQLDLFEKVIKK